MDRHPLHLAVAALALALAATPARAAPRGDAEGLRLARNAYTYGDYKLVIGTLQPLLYPEVRLEDADDVAEARRLLGLAYLFERRQAEAENEFVALLTQRPEAQLDPLVDPPPFVELFDRIKQRMADRLDAIRRERAEAERARAAEDEARRKELASLRVRLADSEASAWVVEASERSRLVALLPFGAGQFQNGHTRKGVLFLVSELALGTASVALAGAVRLRWPDGTFARDERDEADALVSGQVLTGLAFFAAAIWGVVDANVYFVRRAEAAPRRVPRDTLKLGAGVAPHGIVLGGTF